MVKISLDSENLLIDWVSFNLKSLVDSKIIAGRLSKYFIPHIKRHTSLTLKFFTSITNQSNICHLWDFFLIIEKSLEHLKYLFKIKNISMYSLLST